MGRPKALIEVDGSPMVVRVATALGAGGCSPVRLIGGGTLVDDLGYTVVDDRWPGEGPLGGVITALLEAGTDVVVAACDLPDLDGEAVRVIRDAAGAHEVDVVVATTDRLQPALARWNHRALHRLTASFEAGERALHAALRGLHVVEAAVDPPALRNVNTPGEIGDGRASR
jgi:molybdopterin-guanine dinucleotide biosynthesis protein A